jgi:hypothetical protein
LGLQTVPVACGEPFVDEGAELPVELLVDEPFQVTVDLLERTGDGLSDPLGEDRAAHRSSVRPRGRRARVLQGEGVSSTALTGRDDRSLPFRVSPLSR